MKLHYKLPIRIIKSSLSFDDLKNEPDGEYRLTKPLTSSVRFYVRSGVVWWYNSCLAVRAFWKDHKFKRVGPLP